MKIRFTSESGVDTPKITLELDASDIEQAMDAFRSFLIASDLILAMRKI